MGTQHPELEYHLTKPCTGCQNLRSAAVSPPVMAGTISFMEHLRMDEKIFVAVIAACAALLGSLIPQVFSFFKERAERKLARHKEQRDIQVLVYEELLLALQDTMNQGCSSFPAFQKAILKVSLHGDANTSKVLLEYFDTLVKRGRELKAEEHANYQTRILNAMKVQLSLPEVERFEIIRFGVQK